MAVIVRWGVRSKKISACDVKCEDEGRSQDGGDLGLCDKQNKTQHLDNPYPLQGVKGYVLLILKWII